jgi:gluconokinase
MKNDTVILVIGVSGSGKSTIAKDLAARLNFDFVEGDDFHSEAEIAKMHGGTPLTDADRWPWLERIKADLMEHVEARQPVVVACSGLRKAYREHLIGALPDTRLVYLKGSKPVIAARMHRRRNHFMPASLLDSQFAILEEPGPDEHPVVVSVEGSEEATITGIVAGLQR